MLNQDKKNEKEYMKIIHENQERIVDQQEKISHLKKKM